MDRNNDFLILYEGIDEAFVGISDHWGDHGHVQAAVYDFNQCLELFVNRDGMTHEAAMAHMDHNVTGGYHGRRTPVFIFKMEV